MIPKNKSEAHTLNLIKVRSELRMAVEAYKAKNTAAEMYHMCRAKAIADALDISTDEFYDHKRLVELEAGMVDILMSERAVLMHDFDVVIDLR